jgi:hypothetical protein
MAIMEVWWSVNLMVSSASPRSRRGRVAREMAVSFLTFQEGVSRLWGSERMIVGFWPVKERPAKQVENNGDQQKMVLRRI